MIGIYLRLMFKNHIKKSFIKERYKENKSREIVKNSKIEKTSVMDFCLLVAFSINNKCKKIQ